MQWPCPSGEPQVALGSVCCRACPRLGETPVDQQAPEEADDLGAEPGGGGGEGKGWDRNKLRLKVKPTQETAQSGKQPWEGQRVECS